MASPGLVRGSAGLASPREGLSKTTGAGLFDEPSPFQERPKKDVFADLSSDDEHVVFVDDIPTYHLLGEPTTSARPPISIETAPLTSTEAIPADDRGSVISVVGHLQPIHDDPNNPIKDPVIWYTSGPDEPDVSLCRDLEGCRATVQRWAKGHGFRAAQSRGDAGIKATFVCSCKGRKTMERGDATLPPEDRRRRQIHGALPGEQQCPFK